MMDLGIKRASLRFLILLAALLFLAGCTEMPTKEEVRESVEKILPVPFEVLSVRELKEVPGLVEVILLARNQTVVVYLDKKAKYVFSGSLMAVDTKANLTLEAQKRFLRK